MIIIIIIIIIIIVIIIIIIIKYIYKKNWKREKRERQKKTVDIYLRHKGIQWNTQESASSKKSVFKVRVSIC